MLVENGQRSGLDPIEEATALHSLKTGGLVDTEIARRIGRSPAYVHNRLLLLTLPFEDQEELRAGHYSLSDAMTSIRAGRAGAGAVDSEVSGDDHD